MVIPQPFQHWSCLETTHWTGKTSGLGIALVLFSVKLSLLLNKLFTSCSPVSLTELEIAWLANKLQQRQQLPQWLHARPRLIIPGINYGFAQLRGRGLCFAA